MPRSKNTHKYPSYFRDLLLGAYAAKEKGVFVESVDAPSAHRTRRQLYAFMQAVDYEESLTSMPDSMRDAPRLHQVMITVQLQPPFGLKLINKNYTPENLAIARVVESLNILTDDDKVERDYAQQIIDAVERGDLEEADRLQALASGQSPLDTSQDEVEAAEQDYGLPAGPREPGYKTPAPAAPPEPEPETKVVGNDPFSRFIDYKVV